MKNKQMKMKLKCLAYVRNTLFYFSSKTVNINEFIEKITLNNAVFSMNKPNCNVNKTFFP
jgi:protein involved in ribonucleotide reduction